MRLANAVMLALGMFWLGLIFASESFGDIVWLGLGGTGGLLLAVAVTELIGRRGTARGAP